jgi:hypothetical protein
MVEDTPDPWAIMVAEVATKSAREVWRSGDKVGDSPPRMAGPNLLQWAADERLVFASEQDGWMHLYSLPAGGGGPVLLTPGACEFEDATLAPDRRELIYSSNCGDIDRRSLWRVAVTGGQAKKICFPRRGCARAGDAAGDGARGWPQPGGRLCGPPERLPYFKARRAAAGRLQSR